MLNIESWQAQPLGDLISLEYGASLSETIRVDGEYPVYGSNGQIGKHTTFLVRGPGIIVGRKGTVGVVIWSDNSFWPIDTTYYVNLHKNHDLRWCYWQLLSLPIARMDSSTGVPGLNRNDVYKLWLNVPSPSEQSFIAHILDTLDTQIQQTEQLVAKLKQIKLGLLYDLLTRGIDENGDIRDPVAHPERFQSAKLGKIPQEWDILLIKEAGIVQLGRQRSPRHQTGQHTMPYLRVANVFDGFIDFSDILSMDFNPEERKTYNLIPGDILLNEGQSLELVGRSAIYQGPPDTFCFQNTLVRFRCNSRSIPEYCLAVFKYWLDTGKFTTVAKQTTSIAHLGADRFAQMSLCVPSLDEQHRIAVILNSHDARITAEESYLAKLKQLKKGLMHDLLTGRVRVTQLMAESEQLDVRSKSVSGCK